MRRPDDATADTTRRQFLTQTGAIAAGATLLGGSVPLVHAGQDSTIRLALIGCGGRGTGAVRDALSVGDGGPIELYSMADIRQEKMDAAYKNLEPEFVNKVTVTDDRMFVGFEAYKQAIDSLRPGDVAMCTTRAYIRPTHVEYAVSKGINVFMEKPFSPDPVGLRRLLKAGEEADRTGVKIAAGLQCRHSPARQALIEKLRNGELGDVPLVRANRLTRSSELGDMGARAREFTSQLEFGRVHLLWVGSGHMVDNLIHQIDECCWIMDQWPESVHGMGGRTPSSDDHGQNYDIYGMEYVFPDGRRAQCGFRTVDRAHSEFATFIQGTKHSAQFSGDVHKATVHMYKDVRMDSSQIVWKPVDDKVSPWQYEWNDFVASIRNDLPHNECKRAVYADVASLMGRAACHYNRIVTFDEVLNSDFKFCEDVDSLTFDSVPPVLPDEKGQFQVPYPGEWREL